MLADTSPRRKQTNKQTNRSHSLLLALHTPASPPLSPAFPPPLPSPLLPPLFPRLPIGDRGKMATPTTKDLEAAVKTMQDALKLLKDSGAQPKNTQLSAFLLTITPQIVSVASSLAAMLTSNENAKRTSCNLSDKLTRETRQNRDLIDDARQANLTGKIVLNVQDDGLRKAVGLDEQTDYINLNLDALLKAVNKRYSVDIKPDDISDARRTSRKGAITITFWNRKVDSAYNDLCLAMKSPGSNATGKELYANFALTSRRGEILWHVRQHWKNKDIQKFFVDSSGTNHNCTHKLYQENSTLLGGTEGAQFRVVHAHGPGDPGPDQAKQPEPELNQDVDRDLLCSARASILRTSPGTSRLNTTTGFFP